ncbi:uncharacterized protein LOC110569431 isoform X2 [Aotus nancymaae]|uniref:uncharacterized protein LOC110569431 isoform X2 n=1 Tax=Aotus nancymaae TaxID=37293 RepID=UPI0030FE6D50
MMPDSFTSVPEFRSHCCSAPKYECQPNMCHTKAVGSYIIVILLQDEFLLQNLDTINTFTLSKKITATSWKIFWEKY